MRRIKIVYKEIDKIDEQLKALKDKSLEERVTQREILKSRRNSLFMKLIPGL